MRSVEVLFRQWGRWAVLQRDAGVGWPGIAAGFQLVRSSNLYASGGNSVWSVTDADMVAVDRAIGELEAELRQAVVAYYQFADTFRGAAAVVSRAAGATVDHKTIQRRVLRAQSIVADLLGVRLATVGGAR